MKQKVAEFDQFQVRLPAGMRDRIRAAAEMNNRSMNAEMVATLEVAYPQRNEVAALLDEAYRVVSKREKGTLLPFEWRLLPLHLKRLVLQIEVYANLDEIDSVHPRHGRAFAEGREAYRSGKSRDVNPYGSEEAKYDVWLEGFEYERQSASDDADSEE